MEKVSLEIKKIFFGGEYPRVSSSPGTHRTTFNGANRPPSGRESFRPDQSAATITTRTASHAVLSSAAPETASGRIVAPTPRTLKTLLNTRRRFPQRAWRKERPATPYFFCR